MRWDERWNENNVKNIVITVLHRQVPCAMYANAKNWKNCSPVSLVPHSRTIHVPAAIANRCRCKFALQSLAASMCLCLFFLSFVSLVHSFVLILFCYLFFAPFRLSAQKRRIMWIAMKNKIVRQKLHCKRSKMSFFLLWTFIEANYHYSLFGLTWRRSHWLLASNRFAHLPRTSICHTVEHW